MGRSEINTLEGLMRLKKGCNQWNAWAFKLNRERRLQGKCSAWFSNCGGHSSGESKVQGVTILVGYWPLSKHVNILTQGGLEPRNSGGL